MFFAVCAMLDVYGLTFDVSARTKVLTVKYRTVESVVDLL